MDDAPQIPTQPDRYWVCYACRHESSVESLVCDRCGLKRRLTDVSNSPYWTCWSCGWESTILAAECEHCAIPRPVHPIPPEVLADLLRLPPRRRRATPRLSDIVGIASLFAMSLTTGLIIAGYVMRIQGETAWMWGCWSAAVWSGFVFAFLAFRHLLR